MTALAVMVVVKPVIFVLSGAHPLHFKQRLPLVKATMPLQPYENRRELGSGHVEIYGLTGYASSHQVIHDPSPMPLLSVKNMARSVG